ncbi:cytochrome c [Paracoccus sp. 1_MG-2023]|uniref:c-type cytochrome n=1 Tax=unclassified Paracoccus (in: a-proteobacteria) TaxID=2688777 RepID=UPI001C0940C9|nr:MULTISPECIES: cytochrome c [unclassified Paracoccus (in: a-proteobacteria)]MBU2959171.1 cytochrome c [Paracoccus sp. C2R09]MDO6670092.1 cytochrome c [Paracoccus sp. 1_MG-2023]
MRGARLLSLALAGLAQAAAAQDGAALYRQHCASCHGADLEGQADWRSRGPDGRLAAPPHDATGHTWHHGDDLLLRITREGKATVVGGGYDSAMPGFGDRLDDARIRRILDYIKSTWPERERAFQKKVSGRERVAD